MKQNNNNKNNLRYIKAPPKTPRENLEKEMKDKCRGWVRRWGETPQKNKNHLKWDKIEKTFGTWKNSSTRDQPLALEARWKLDGSRCEPQIEWGDNNDGKFGMTMEIQRSVHCCQSLNVEGDGSLRHYYTILRYGCWTLKKEKFLRMTKGGNLMDRIKTQDIWVRYGNKKNILELEHQRVLKSI